MSQELHELAGIYALDALPEDEQAEFEEHLEQCEACRREVVELQATTSALAVAVEETPPAGLRDRVLAQVDQTPQEAGPDTDDAGPDDAGTHDAGTHDAGTDDAATGAGDELAARRAARSAARPWWAGVLAPAAAIVVVLLVGVSFLVADLYDRIDELEATSTQVEEVLAAPDAQTITVEGEEGSFARVVASASRGEAVFLADGMSPLDAEQTFQLWLIDEEGADPAGLFDVDEQGRTTQVLAGDLRTAAAIGVTVEPAGGSPQPTTDPVMVIELENV